MKIFKYAVMALVLLATTQLEAQKFGYVNSQALLAEMPEVKQAEANLDALKKQLQKKGQQMLTDLETKYKELQRKEAQGELSPKQIESEAQKIKEEESKIARFEQDMQQQLMKKQEELMQPVIDKVNTAISNVAEEGGYEYIFDAVGGFILYADESNDVTAQVKAKLGL
ncbi:MAG: OmpH family outer membrane protein [Saprospiraceae bacterium]|nr:OmpH family outer membrane protein [Saprospiraceae bacterium]